MAIDRSLRRWFGRHSIDDPRPLAAEAPYTFFLPSPAQIAAIATGDSVKVIIRSIPASSKWDAERMWIKVTSVSEDEIAGELDNVPSDIPHLRPGSPLLFAKSSVIDILWSDNRSQPPPPTPERREYWERCMVDACIMERRSPVDYLYREQPDLAGPDDTYPDSGWRLRGTDAGIDEDHAEGRGPQYVALGAVLNRDDSWLDLIDAPTGSRFTRDGRTNRFVPLAADQ